MSIVESCIVVGVLCLLLMSLFELFRLIAAREILDYAAARGARAKAVGFNEFMVFKSVHVGAIPNAGVLIEPDVSGGPLEQRAAERGRIPLYMGAQNPDWLDDTLDYEDWGTIFYSYVEFPDPPLVQFHVSQNVPLRAAMHRAFYAEDSIPFTGEATVDNHYPFYLQP